LDRGMGLEEMEVGRKSSQVFGFGFVCGGVGGGLFKRGEEEAKAKVEISRRMGKGGRGGIDVVM